MALYDRSQAMPFLIDRVSKSGAASKGSVGLYRGFTGIYGDLHACTYWDSLGPLGSGLWYIRVTRSALFCTMVDFEFRVEGLVRIQGFLLDKSLRFSHEWCLVEICVCG